MMVRYCVGQGAALPHAVTPFIAKDFAVLQQGSGLGYRAIIFWPFLAIGIHHVWAYARRVQRNPEASLVYGVVSARPPASDNLPEMTGRSTGVNTAPADETGMLADAYVSM